MQLISLHSGRRKGTLIAVALLVAVSIQWLPLGAGERGDGRGDGHGDPPILPPGGPRAAMELESTPLCDTEVINKGLALLEWKLASEPGSEQLVQVTIFREGFETGRIVSSNPLPPDQTTLRFVQVAGQALHRWRVLTLHTDGFVPSHTAHFTGPICIFDEAEEDDDDVPESR